MHHSNALYDIDKLCYLYHDNPCRIVQVPHMTRHKKHYTPRKGIKRRPPASKTFHGHRPATHVQPKQLRMKPEAETGLKEIFSHIGTPPQTPFRPDPFQTDALQAIELTDCLVTAPTGAGKTWIAEQAILSVFKRGGRAWYASPLKALTNSKWVEFGDRFGPGNVGILTGDTKENADAPIIVGTTEILRNQLYDVMHRGGNLNYDLVILDEAHFLGDPERGVVWEEIMIYLPTRIHLLLLSATIGNAHEIAGWLASIRNKGCTVIEDKKRPVPLHPLFLHPSGRLMPLLSRKKLFKKVVQYLADGGSVYQPGNRMPPFEDIIRVMRKFRLLPAIFFLKSRNECNVAVSQIKAASHRTPLPEFERDLGRVIDTFPYLRHHEQLSHLTRCRVGAHHGGQLPAWKFTIETMMKTGHLDAVFATTTVAAGVNFPARSVVLFNSDQFNGHEFLPLTATEFHQMTGRAGRRGLDNIGFVLLIPQRYMNVAHIKNIHFSRPEYIISRIRNDFSMVLNLLLSHKPDDIRNIFERSFANYQQRNMSENTVRFTLWKDFQRHLSFLKSEGFVAADDTLTEQGAWTSQLRLDQPLLISECLEKGAFPPDDEALLAAVVAPFVYDRDMDIAIRRREHSKTLLAAYDKTVATVTPLIERMKDAQFSITPLPLWTSIAVYSWARGVDWTRITKQLHIADGDLTMLISRTADNLNQIAALKRTHPAIAACAAAARNTLLREPVVFEEA